jgi:inositol-pentakisphosphate 2-kinase
MDASEWRYVGEGGKHALFAYHPVGNCNERWQGRLIRLRKRDLARSATLSQNCVAVKAGKSLSEPEDPLYYIRNVVAPSISYVDIPEIIPLDWCFLNRLRQRTLLDGRIPPSREEDWSLPASSKFHDYTDTITGMLVHDYRRLSLPDSISGKLMSEGRISIEIKPKAGYIAFSPLVHPLHRVKYQKSRFILLQKLHQQGHVEKGWTNSSQRIEMSEYDPIDLFSNDRSRMRRAIASLFSCPQNNLRIWYNDSPLIADKLNAAESKTLSSEIIQSIFDLSDPESPGHLLESIIGDIILSILYYENLLPRLLKLQELDILDADGAVIVFQRLVELCGGCHKKAERKLDTLDLPKATSDHRDELLNVSPFEISRDALNIALLCDEIAEFRQKLDSTAPTLPPSNQLDDLRMRVIRRIESLSVEECQFLLLNWLFSLAMCDVSIFITFQVIQRASEVPNNADLSSHQERKPTLQTTILGGADAGLGQFSCSVNSKTVSCAYNIRLIDCDRKPANKLRLRQEKELVFRNSLEFR